MPRNFDWQAVTAGGQKGARRWLQIAVATLAILNGFALFVYIEVGSRHELMQQSLQVRRETKETQNRAMQEKALAEEAQVGAVQASAFQSNYFLPKRVAYEKVIEEIQRMAKASGLQEREAVYTEEPIEGTENLSILNATATYEGPYDGLMKFLHEADTSQMLLMLETMTASPQQRGNQINTSIRFQAIIEEPAIPVVGGQQ